MTIFDDRNKAERVIQTKALDIYQMLKLTAKELNVEFPWFSRGVYLELQPHTITKHIDNPNYDPSLPHTPENRAKQTGFSWLSIEENFIQFSANEHEDQYEDLDCDSYHFDIPTTVFFGTSEELLSFIKSHLQKDVDRKERNERRKYLEIFDFDKKIIQDIFAYCMLNNIKFENISDYRDRENILKKIGVMHDDD